MFKKVFSPEEEVDLLNIVEEKVFRIGQKRIIRLCYFLV